MELNDIKKNADQKMNQSLDALKNNLGKVRTGRANPALLDTVDVEYYGSMVPMSQVANLTLLDARTIGVAPWEKGMGPKIEKAIGYPLTLDGIQLKFFDEISFWGLRVKDPWGKDMIYIEQLDVNFSISDLFLQGSQPSMEYAQLIRPRVHLILEKKYLYCHLINMTLNKVLRTLEGLQNNA